MGTSFMPEMKFMLTGHSGFYNRGCEAIVRSTVDLLWSKLPHSKILLYSSDTANDVSQIEDNRIHVKSWPPPRLSADWFMNGLCKRVPRLGQIFNRKIGPFYYDANACLSIGGDNYTLDYGFPGTLLLRDQLTMQAGIPLVIWGASIGPFESSTGAKTRMKEHLKTVDLITARENATVEYLKSLGITRNVVRVFDPAFSLKPESYSGHENKFLDFADVLGINICSLIAKWRSDKNLDLLIDEIARFVEAVLAEGLKVLLVPHVTSKTHGLENDDESVLTMVLKRKMFRSESVAILPGNLKTRQIKWFISKCRFFIGARTHSTIAAISSGVPTISIAYSQKARGINRDIFDHEDYVLETPLVSKGPLMNKLRLLLKNESVIRSLLKDKESEMIRNAQKNVDALMDLIEQKN